MDDRVSERCKNRDDNITERSEIIFTEEKVEMEKWRNIQGQPASGLYQSLLPGACWGIK